MDVMDSILNAVEKNGLAAINTSPIGVVARAGYAVLKGIGIIDEKSKNISKATPNPDAPPCDALVPLGGKPFCLPVAPRKQNTPSVI